MTIHDNSAKVSVLMPVFNPDPGYFRQALESILRQTMTNLEVVIVEDPSPRFAVETLDKIHDPRIRHVRNTERTSLVRQLNQGLALASAPLVARMDADDVARADRLEKQVAYLESHPDIDVVGSWIDVIDEQDRTIGRREYPTDNDCISRSLRRLNALAHPTVLYRRRVVQDAGGYQYEEYPATEDYDLWCRLARRGIRFANLPEPLLSYRIHPEGMKTSRLRGILRGTLVVKQMHWRKEMNLLDRLRLWAERLLLIVPSPVVLALFKRLHYRARRAGSPPSGAGR